LPLRVFQEWQTNIARPVVVAVVATFLTTAGGVFLGYLLGSRFPYYPLQCFAEPYRTEDMKSDEMLVDFYIVNPGKEIDRDTLQARLNSSSASGYVSLQPDTILKMNTAGKVERVDNHEEDFNLHKGHVTASHGDRFVKIQIYELGQRSIWKTTIKFSGLSRTNLVSRAATVALPFDYGEPQQHCYGST